MTLRKLIRTVNIDDVYRYIWEKDQKNYAECDRPTMQDIIGSYGNVIQELVNKPKAKANPMPFCVENAIDPFDNTEYVDVFLLNTKYVEPKKGLQPWGTSKGGKTPKGHYNINNNKYNKRFGVGMTSWSKMIDTKVIINDKIDPAHALGEILWEITFYGWTEDKHNEGVDNLSKRLEEAMAEIKNGKCIEIPPSKGGKYTVVIPDSVSKQIVDIANSKKKKK